MEILRGRSIWSVAILSCVVQITLAAVADIECPATTCVTHSTCVDGNCKCDAAYKEGTGGDENTCVPKVLGDPCDTDNTNTDCAAVTNAVCKDVSGTNKCACDGQYKESGAQCVQKGIGDSCDGEDDCVGVDNAECSTTCKCSADYTAINNLCQKGLGNSCTDNTDCTAVSNAVCDTDSEVCTCNANFKEDNGLCSSADGLQTLLSAPVALMLSFLTIVVTKLH